MAGGNTFYLMQELKKKKLIFSIKRAIKNGTPYIGSSAGSVILCPIIFYVKEIDNYKKHRN